MNTTCIECGSKNIDHREESSRLLCVSCEEDFRHEHCNVSPEAQSAIANNEIFKNIVLLSANSPEELRPCDVDRVMYVAYNSFMKVSFRRWLLFFDLQERTRALVDAWEAE